MAIASGKQKLGLGILFLSWPPKPKPRWELHFATMAKARQV